jgi:hypothetical protein
MIFEVINDKGEKAMYTEYISCIPDKEILTSMYNVGYKFRLDGKAITIKKLKDMIKEIDNDKDN